LRIAWRKRTNAAKAKLLFIMDASLSLEPDTQKGVLASLRRLFAKTEVNEFNGDFSPIEV
jgi:hypothetical protein